MPSNITFATDRDQVIPAFYSTLDSVAIVLRKFSKTLIDVDGHTDSTGSASYNQGLSERRAASVANYLASRGVDQRRMSGPEAPDGAYDMAVNEAVAVRCSFEAAAVRVSR